MRRLRWAKMTTYNCNTNFLLKPQNTNNILPDLRIHKNTNNRNNDTIIYPMMINKTAKSHAGKRIFHHFPLT
jgi:hypothetical protein